jgi:GNAT superfamily N-acetyltransferase
VAEEGTEVTGSIRGKSIGTSVAIGRLSVLPGRQGKGAGTSLLQEIEKSFPRAIRFELFTGHKSEKNKQFYQRLGYRWYRDEKIDESLSLYWMEKHKDIIQAEIRDQ